MACFDGGEITMTNIDAVRCNYDVIMATFKSLELTEVSPILVHE